MAEQGPRRSSRLKPTNDAAPENNSTLPPNPPAPKSKARAKANPKTSKPGPGKMSKKTVASKSSKQDTSSKDSEREDPANESAPIKSSGNESMQFSKGDLNPVQPDRKSSSEVLDESRPKDPMAHLLSQVRLPASPARPLTASTSKSQLVPSIPASDDVQELPFRGNLGTTRTGGLWDNPQVRRTLDSIHEDERAIQDDNLRASWQSNTIFGPLGLGSNVKLEGRQDSEKSDYRKPSEETLIDQNTEFPDVHDEEMVSNGLISEEEDDSEKHRVIVKEFDDDGDDSSDDFMDIAVEQERVLARKGFRTVDEEDADLDDEYLAETAGSRDKGKGKAVVKSSNPTLRNIRPTPPQSRRSSETLSEHHRDQVGDNPAIDQNGTGDDSDEDDPADTTWPLKPGSLSKADMEEVLQAREAYHAVAESVARRSGKKLSTVFKAVGDNPLATRDVNPWNAWQSKYRIENPRQDHEHPSEFKARMRADYIAQFDQLPEEERSDPDARRRLLQPIIKAHLDNNMLVLDDRKSKGGAQALLSKALRSFINMSTAVSHKEDIHVFGVGVDIVHDVAFSWGGSTLYEETKKRHVRNLNTQMNDMKALLQVTNMELRDEAGEEVDEIEVAVHPDWDKRSGEVARDVVRRNVREMFMNAIQLILISRGHSLLEARKIFPKMSWKWCDEAVQHHLRIINWPNALKLHYPRPGFNPQQITNKSKSSDDGEGEEQGLTKSLVDMRDAMRRVFEGGNEAAATVVSWTDAEIGLDDPRDVPIVVAADGSTLLTARASEALIRKLHKAAKKRRTAAEKAEKAAAAKAAPHKPARKSDDNDESSGSDEEDDNSAPPTPVKRSNHVAPSSRANATASSSRAPNATASSSRGTKRPIQSVDAMENPVPKRQHRYEDAPTTTWKCRYVYRGRESGTFYAVGMSAYEGNPTPLQDSTYYSAPSGWVKVPQGLQPIVAKEEEGARLLRSMEVGLGL
ncbi:hypothetical protein R3P38DRAFT_3264717 [Favolaschia claudopus]|uniref:Uncharacterized protein n=1 Tax=Favolaschia claudopus TaxID=2862362 RepID=A0AAW0C089_9AGAR